MEFLGHHLLQVLQSVQKHEVAVGGQGQRILLLEKVQHILCNGYLDIVVVLVG